GVSPARCHFSVAVGLGMGAGLWLRRQAHPTWADQAGIRRLEPPESSADRSLKIDVLVVGAAERKIGRGEVAVRDRYEANDEATRVDLDNAAEPAGRDPQVSFDIVVDAVGTAVTGHIGTCLDSLKRQMQRVRGGTRDPHRRAGGKGGVPHAPCIAVADRYRAVVRGDGDPIRKQAAVHHLAQHTVTRILVNRSAAVGYVGSRTGAPGVGEKQVALGIEIEVVGAFKQLVAVGVGKRLQLFSLRVVDEDAAVSAGQVELAVLPTGALRLAGLTDLRW